MRYPVTKIIHALFRSHISWGHRTVYASVIRLEGTGSLPKGRGLANKGKQDRTKTILHSPSKCLVRFALYGVKGP